jgi:hypothetical protein
MLVGTMEIECGLVNRRVLFVVSILGDVDGER